MKRKRVVLGQLGWAYDDEVWLPTASGALAAHCLSSAEFNGAYEIDPWLRYERDEPITIVGAMNTPDVVALSHYVWNEQINFAVLCEVKRHWPHCLTVLGGPSVGDAGPLAENLLREHPEVDVFVHGEGEETFRALLLGEVQDQGRDWHDVLGLSWLGGHSAPRPRQKNLDEFPSPFLTGVFDPVLERGARKGQHFSVCFEPDRGCPWCCRFCFWGGATGVKVHTFGLERLKAELDWIATHRLGFVYGASANFGLNFNRDWELAEYMVILKHHTGFPQHYFTNTSKNATERIFKLSKLLHDAGLSKGATLSMQSWNEQTLVAIGRSNIKSSTYENLQTMFREAGVPTYAEIILALPEETLLSFCDGIDKNLDAGQHDGLMVYLARVLAGTEMADPAYRQQYGIETVRLPIQANHGSLDAASIGPTEFEETVIATATMSHEDWLQAQRISWFVQVFFVLGLARLPLLWFRERGVKVTEFAQWALDACYARVEGYGVPLYPALWLERHRLERYLASQDLGAPEVDRDDLDSFPAIRWPIEEASLLALLSHKDVVYRELKSLFWAFIDEKQLYGAPGENTRDPLNEALVENAKRIKHWSDGVSPSDPATFAREICWFGRRGGSMLHPERVGIGSDEQS